MNWRFLSIIGLGLFLLSQKTIVAQETDPVLFTIGDTEVRVSEFNYIYAKTNGQNANYSRASVEEYLDLYVNFKLKVQEAKGLKIDTIPSLKEELAGYRRQLADSYLINKEVLDKLTRELYERVKEEVEISHIFVKLPANPSNSDIEAAKAKLDMAMKDLKAGQSFEEAARQYSEDNNTREKGGKIGFITAMLPRGFYPLEKTVYEMSVGEISDPIQTSAGLHLVKVHSRRPARGQVEVAHILFRTNDDNPAEAKQKAKEAWVILGNGADFEGLARGSSQDQRTAPNGGYIGFIGINQFESSFEDAAFGIPEDGGISEPIQSSLGWHIIKRISYKPIQPFALEKSRLETNIRKDTRFEEAQDALINQIKMDNNFSEDTTLLRPFAQNLDDAFLSFRWKAPVTPSKKTLFTLGDSPITMGDFTTFLGQASRQRITLNGKVNNEEAVLLLYQEFVRNKCLAYEERNLEQKYPDFKSLMREYEEGILLFEVTKMTIWDKAAQDTLGLRNFYDAIRGKYRWGQRAVTSIYHLDEAHKDKIREVMLAAGSKTPDEVLAQFNQDAIVLNVEEKTVEKGISNLIPSENWKTGFMSQPISDKKRGTLSFYKIENILPPTEKELSESKGYVIADYQDHLEDLWVESLKEKYEVSIDEKVLENLIKE